MKRTITKSLGDETVIEIPDPNYYNEDNKFVKVRRKSTNVTSPKIKRKKKHKTHI